MSKTYFCACLYLLIAFSVSVNANNPKNGSALTLNDLSSIREVKTSVISPDGNFVAFTTNVSASAYSGTNYTHLREIYLADKKGRLTPFVAASPLGYLSWSSDSKTIWFLSKQDKDQTISLYRISVGGGEAQKVFNFKTDIGGYHIARDNKNLLFWALPAKSERQMRLNELGFDAEIFEEAPENQFLYRVDIDSDEATVEIVISDKHIISAQWNNDSDSILVQHALTSLTDNVVMNKTLSLYSDKGALLNSFVHSGKMGNARFSPDGKQIALIGSQDSNDPEKGRLYLGSVSSPKLTNILTDFDGHVEDIVWLSNKSIGFIAQRGLETFLASKKVPKPSNSYRVLLKNAGIFTALSADKSGKNIVLNTHNQQHPTELYWYKRSGTRRFTNSNLWLKNKKLAAQQQVEFTARDGTKIQGIMIPPTQKTDGKAPLIIFVHGGPESHFSDGWLNYYSHPVNDAANKGFYSFLPNYRGSTGRGVAYSKLGQQDYAGAEFNDLLDAKNWATKNYPIDPDLVGITGASYGGYAAAWAATKFSQEFAASVSSMGIANQISKFGTTDIATEMIQLHALINPWQDWQWYLERSPIKHVGNAQTPILLMHGQLDLRVPYSQSVELYRHLKVRSDTPVRLVLFPTEGHGFVNATSRLEYSERLMRWMSHFLIEQHQNLPDIDLPHTELVPN